MSPSRQPSASYYRSLEEEEAAVSSSSLQQRRQRQPFSVVGHHQPNVTPAPTAVRTLPPLSPLQRARMRDPSTRPHSPPPPPPLAPVEKRPTFGPPTRHQAELAAAAETVAAGANGLGPSAAGMGTNTFFSCSLFELTQRPSRAFNSPHALLPEIQ